MTKSRQFEVRVRGDLACFTRPEMKVERMTYEVMTPSAARGVLEAVLWKPAIVWRIQEILVGKPLQWISFRRNEVNSKLTGAKKNYFADEDRAQRNTVALKDVDYLVKAHFELTERAGAEDNVTKFEEMFWRRLQKGQHFSQPYLGCREFAADVSPVVEGFKPQHELTRPLGLMFFDYRYPSPGSEALPQPMFFNAEIREGVLTVPSWQAALAENEVRS